VGLGLTIILAILIGLIISSAFSAILAIDRTHPRKGRNDCWFIFLALHLVWGELVQQFWAGLQNQTSIEYVFNICAYLPLIGVVTGLLPNISQQKK
jgi:FSR family fosmidomycin resistance protein-like MFS transporter